MKNHERTYELVVTATVVVVFAALWLIKIATSEPPEFAEQYVQYAIVWVLFTTPWAIAARLLWHHYLTTRRTRVR